MSDKDPNRTIVLGQRVYYRDGGPSDTGTVIGILLDDTPFVIKWDKGKPDEKIDRYYGSQLELVD